MARSNDREFSLRRKVKDLEALNEKLELELAKLKKQNNKEVPKESLTVNKKAGKVIQKPCPDCGQGLKTTDLPHATMELCSAGCGYRNVRNKK